MKQNKNLITYIILSVCAVGCLTAAIILGFNIFGNNSVTIEDFTNKSKVDVLKWVTKNKVENYITYEYEYSTEAEEGFIINQSLEPKSKVESNFTVTVSKGSIISLTTSEYKTKKDFADFISKYNNVKVLYDGEAKDDSEIEKFSKNQIDIKADEITVYLKAKSENNKDDNKDNETGDKATIPNNLLGIKEEDFIKKLNDLGFKNLKKDTIKYYSFTSKKDTIFSYDDGTYDKRKTINYAISLGDYPTAFDAKEYNNKTLTDVNSLVKKYNDLNAHITLNTNTKKTSDNNLVNKVDNCKASKKDNKSIITCDLYSKETKSENVESYANKPEKDLLNGLKAKGFTKFNRTDKYSSTQLGCIISNDTGNKLITDTINYVVSNGLYEINLNDFEGKPKSNAESLIVSVKAKGADISSNWKTTETEDYSDNILFDCSKTSNTITCNLAKHIIMVELAGSNTLINLCADCQSYDATVTRIKGYLQGFTNIRFNKVSTAMSPGQIKEIRVNGNATYTPGKFKSDTLIEIDICNEQLN